VKNLSYPSTNGFPRNLPRMRLDCPRPDMGNSSTRTQKNCKGPQVHELELELFPSQYLPIAKILEFQLPQKNYCASLPGPRALAVCFAILCYFFSFVKISIAQKSFSCLLTRSKNKVFTTQESPSQVPNLFTSRPSVTRHLNKRSKSSRNSTVCETPSAEKVFLIK
jgi:hypothetical protein